MSDQPVRKLRPDAHQVYVYNSAGIIYLYDEANAETIKDAGPSLLSGYRGDAARDVDAALLSLGERGMLVVFELYQDDELQAELSVGPALSPAEAGAMPWSAPRRALLSLPSGTLCIDSMDTSPLGPDEPSDEGVRVTVEPGDYVVSVQCLGRACEQDAKSLVPEYFISLVARAAVGERPANCPFLSYPRE